MKETTFLIEKIAETRSSYPHSHEDTYEEDENGQLQLKTRGMWHERLQGKSGVTITLTSDKIGDMDSIMTAFRENKKVKIVIAE